MPRRDPCRRAMPIGSIFRLYVPGGSQTRKTQLFIVHAARCNERRNDNLYFPSEIPRFLEARVQPYLWVRVLIFGVGVGASPGAGAGLGAGAGVGAGQLARERPNVGRILGAELGRFRPNVCRSWPLFARSQPNLGRSRPHRDMSGKVRTWPLWTNTVPKSANLRRRSRGQAWSDFGRLRAPSQPQRRIFGCMRRAISEGPRRPTMCPDSVAQSSDLDTGIGGAGAFRCGRMPRLPTSPYRRVSSRPL